MTSKITFFFLVLGPNLGMLIPIQITILSLLTILIISKYFDCPTMHEVLQTRATTLPTSTHLCNNADSHWLSYFHPGYISVLDSLAYY